MRRIKGAAAWAAAFALGTTAMGLLDHPVVAVSLVVPTVILTIVAVARSKWLRRLQSQLGVRRPMTLTVVATGVLAIVSTVVFVWLVSARWPIFLSDDAPSLVISPPQNAYDVRWVPKEHLAIFFQKDAALHQVWEVEQPVFFIHNAGRANASDVIVEWRMNGAGLADVVSTAFLREVKAKTFNGGCSMESPITWLGGEHSMAMTCADVASSPRIPFIPQSARIEDVISVPMPLEIVGSLRLRLIALPRPTDIVERMQGPTISVTLRGRNGADQFQDQFLVITDASIWRDGVVLGAWNNVDQKHRWPSNLRGTVRFDAARAD